MLTAENDLSMVFLYPLLFPRGYAAPPPSWRIYIPSFRKPIHELYTASASTAMANGVLPGFLPP